jgi:hypothetical protein
MRLCWSILSILMFSCNHKQNSPIIPANMTDTIAVEQDKAEDSVYNSQKNDTISMLIEDENGKFTAFGTIDSVSHVYIKFTNEDTGNLTAAITPIEGTGNIRFNQILFPDKTADGPFGKEMVLELKQTGEHTLIIGHSLMADHPYSGKFKVELQVVEE